MGGRAAAVWLEQALPPLPHRVSPCISPTHPHRRAPSQAGRGSQWCHPPPCSTPAAASEPVQPQCRDAPTKAQLPGPPPHRARDRLPSQSTAVCLRDPAKLMVFRFLLKTLGPGDRKSGKIQLTQEEGLAQPHAPCYRDAILQCVTIPKATPATEASGKKHIPRKMLIY